MRPVLPVLVVLAATAGAVTTVALRWDHGAAGPSKIEAGVTRCTSDGCCTFEDERGALSAAKSVVSNP